MDVSENFYQFTVFTLVELTEAMRLISDQAMKHNGNTSAETQFLVIANGLSQLDASINGIRREDIKAFSRDAIAPVEANWGEAALVIDPCNMNFVLDKLDDVCDELKSQIKARKAILRHCFGET